MQDAIDKDKYKLPSQKELMQQMMVDVGFKSGNKAVEHCRRLPYGTRRQYMEKHNQKLREQNMLKQRV